MAATYFKRFWSRSYKEEKALDLFALAVTVIFTVVLSGCASSPDIKRPAWTDEPGRGAVGSSVAHVRGHYYQEQLAIARARERLAAERGVQVNSVFIAEQTTINERASTIADHTMSQAVSDVTVKAGVRALWRDPVSNEVWVWVYPVEN